MSDSEPSADGAASATVSDEGITLEKTLVLERFDTPAVVFRIRSDRDTPAYVRATDPLPERVDPNDVGLHPDYDEDGWHRQGTDLRFEGRLDAGATVETVYGLRMTGIDDPSEYLIEPAVDRVVEATPEDGDDERDDDAVSTAVTPASATDDRDDEDDEDDEDGPTVTIDPEPPDVNAGDSAPAAASVPPSSDVDAGGGTGDAGDPDRAPAATATTGADGSVAAALAAELERGAVDEATLETLNDHLDPDLAGSTRVRIEDLQARTSDLEAYADALETVLDRVGTDDDVVGSIEALRGDVSGLQSSTESLRADLTALEDGVGESVDDLEAEVSSLADDAEALDGRVADLRSELSELDDRMSELSGLADDIEELRQWRRSLAASIAGAGAGTAGEEED